MSINSPFFNRVLLSKGSLSPNIIIGQKPTFVDVGAEGDCGFLAIAAAKIDNVLLRPRSNQKLLTKLLERHNSYFPLAQSSARLLTPAERVGQMINKPEGMTKLIRELAYTLRQIAVDELCLHPELYRGAFADKNEQTSPALMRKPGTWIDESAIAAVANALNWPITVQVVETGKELPLRLQYGPNAKEADGDNVVVKLQRSHYTAQVVQAELFKKVALNSTRPALPVVIAEHNDPDLSTILARIKEIDQRLVQEFEQNLHRLTTMVSAGEVKKSQLLAIYVKGMARSDYLRGRVMNVGIEHGNQQFFEDAINNAKYKIATSANVQSNSQNNTQSNYDSLITSELVHAIARALSIGQLDESNVFAQIEREEKPSLAIKSR